MTDTRGEARIEAPARAPAARRRPRRHWGAFTLGVLIGGAAGAVYGVLKAPRSGAQARALLSAGVEQVVGRLSREVETRRRQIAAELARDPVQEAIDAGKAAARAFQAGRGGEGLSSSAASADEDEAQ